MKSWMDKHGWDSVNIILLIGILWKLSALSTLPPFFPLMSWETAPRELQAPQGVERATFTKLEQVGTPVNVEDIIRELHQNPALIKNSDKRGHIIGQLRRMQTSQNNLLVAEESILTLEKKLNQLALQMLEELTEEQKQALIERRNTDSVRKIEQKYWEELILKGQQP